MRLNDIIENVVDAVTGRDNNDAAAQQPNADPNYADTTGSDQNILPASMDPLGDPADQNQYGGYQNVDNQTGEILPASMDPLGDPADQQQEGGILPASMDPLGDPADNPRR